MTTKEIKDKIPEILLKALANTYTLYSASQIAHWNIEGPEFVQLHQLFSDSYSDAADAVDSIAERIRQLDVIIPKTLSELISHTTAKFDSEQSYVDQIKSIHEKLVEQWNDIAVVAEAAEDSATVDMAGKRAGQHDKFVWILRSLSRKTN